MAREIERKYLVRNDSWRAQARPGIPYRQGYLSNDPERTVRVRVAGDKGYLTIKGKSAGAGRDEFEYPVPLADAEQMLRMCAGPLIEKKRYIVPAAGGLKWEIDEFEGANAGLILAEIEIPDENLAVDKPEWAGDEVTGDRRYYNATLSRHPFSEWGGGRSG